MPPRGSFQRRILLLLLFFALLPSLLLPGVGMVAVREALSLSGSAAAWEQVGASGGALIDAATAAAPDPGLLAAAARHRQELSASLMQARRWEYLLGRAVGLVLLLWAVVAAIIVVAATRAARAAARSVAGPISEFAGWARLLARDEPLPGPRAEAEDPVREFATLRVDLRQMAAEIAASRERALEAERLMTWTSMARSVAHELKNPLTPLRLATRTLAGEPRLSAAAAEALEVLGRETDRLDDLARAFAQFGRMPEGPPSEIDLRELFEYLLRTHLPPGIESRLNIEPEVPLLCGHYDALSRAFSNLLLNAAEAMTQRGGSLLVQVSLLAGGRAEVRVRDSGPGIPPDLLARIWEPNFTTRPRGTGLGLALVRQTIVAHGGTVAAHNVATGGAEVCVVLPLAAAKQEAAEPAGAVFAPRTQPPGTAGGATGVGAEPASAAAE